MLQHCLHYQLRTGATVPLLAAAVAWCYFFAQNRLHRLTTEQQGERLQMQSYSRRNQGDCRTKKKKKKKSLSSTFAFDKRVSRRTETLEIQ